MSQPRISNFSIPSIRSSSYFRFVSILPDVYPWKSVQNWDHGYPSPVNTGGGTGNSRISFDHRAFRKSLSPARRTVRHWPILQTCPGFQFITGIPPQHYERTNRIRWPTTVSSPRIPQGIPSWVPIVSPIFVYRRYSFSLRQNHTLLKRSSISLQRVAIKNDTFSTPGKMLKCIDSKK